MNDFHKVLRFLTNLFFAICYYRLLAISFTFYTKEYGTNQPGIYFLFISLLFSVMWDIYLRKYYKYNICASNDFTDGFFDYICYIILQIVGFLVIKMFINTILIKYDLPAISYLNI